jgi:hypothetical protein
MIETMKLPLNIFLSILTDRVYFSLSKVGLFGIRIGRTEGLIASLNTGNDGWLAYRMEPDYDEHLVWQLGPFYYTLPETEEQRLEREDAEMEAAWLEREANRYTQWSH